jgi:hypothetical protein
MIKQKQTFAVKFTYNTQKIEGSKLTGTAPAIIPAGSKGAIQLTLPSGTNVRATF